MKIIIISGFLGAGKTTFIKKMVEQTKCRFVILENEFGELGLDGELLKQNAADDEMAVWELTEGCICCSPNLDLSYSILTIANTLDPDYLLIEPSGVALPSNILTQINRITYEKISLSAPITLIDALHYHVSRKHFPDYFHDQLNTAATVVVSKSEHFSETDFSLLKKDLQLNENIAFPQRHYEQWESQQWFDLLDKQLTIEEKNGQPHYRFFSPDSIQPEPLENISIASPTIISLETLANSLFLLTTGLAGQIVRVKGYAKLKGYWFRFDIVEGQYSITGCEPMPDERMVVIGKKLNKPLIRSLL